VWRAGKAGWPAVLLSDTFCINKANKAEYSLAIWSTFRWYRNAARYYIYLPDVSALLLLAATCQIPIFSTAKLLPCRPIARYVANSYPGVNSAHCPDHKAILETNDIHKVFFDVRNDSEASFHRFQICLQGVDDVQLMELATRTFLLGSILSMWCW
jgi:GT2 family glycosyltransferase